MASVSFKNIAKVFDDGSRAVSDFNLEINDGELMVLVGPSGCGKSTLLRMLAGLEAVSEGELCIDDQSVNDLTPQQRNIAMVFQNYALYPHMTVRRNLEFPLRMMKRSKGEMGRRVAEVAQLLGLTSLLERRPKQLSGGQRQRVAMGRAMVREPRVFLLDEPLSNLDAKLRLQIRSEIATLQRRMQTTTLYVTHDQVEAMTLGDRVAVINRGRLQQVAAPQLLYERPANLFVAGFIGSPGMNVFRTALAEDENQRPALQWGEQRLPLNAQQITALAGCQGQPLFAGLRPEAIRHPDAGGVVTTISARVESVEALGHEFLVYFRAAVSALDTDRFYETGEDAARPAMVARLARRPQADAGDSIALGLVLDELCFFDARGMAIELPAGSGGNP